MVGFFLNGAAEKQSCFIFRDFSEGTTRPWCSSERAPLPAATSGDYFFRYRLYLKYVQIFKSSEIRITSRPKWFFMRKILFYCNIFLRAGKNHYQIRQPHVLANCFSEEVKHHKKVLAKYSGKISFFFFFSHLEKFLFIFQAFLIKKVLNWKRSLNEKQRSI